MKKTFISKNELMKENDLKKLIAKRLKEAGFDMKKPYTEMIDFTTNRINYKQED